MTTFLRWLLTDRLKCALFGHRWTPARVRRIGSAHSGYRCDRCAKTQLILFRWQEVVDDDD